MHVIIIFISFYRPDKNFISVISELPLIYFMVGSLRRYSLFVLILFIIIIISIVGYSINDLIRAGIMCADCLIVMSPSDIHSNAGTHESLADAENIAALHKIARCEVYIYICVQGVCNVYRVQGVQCVLCVRCAVCKVYCVQGVLFAICTVCKV